MKILHTADWHIGNFHGPEKDGKNLRLQDTYNCICHLIKTAKEEKPDLTLISGDIFHAARVWADRGLSEVQMAIELIEELAHYSSVIVMRGTPNHDGAEQFQMLKKHFNKLDPFARAWVVDTPKVIEVMLNNDHICDVACMPGFDRGFFRAKYPGLSKEDENRTFTEELGKIVLGLKAQCTPDMPSILMSHYTVPGCNMESGQTQFFSGVEPVLLPEMLDAAAFDLVALGHIHRPQQFVSCKNTFYSGAINAMNFNDEAQNRGFWIHELEPDLPYDRLIKSTFFETPYRQFYTMEWTDCEITAILNGDIDDVAENWWLDPVKRISKLKDKIVRVLYECGAEKDKAFNRAALEQRLYEDGAFWVSEISRTREIATVSKNSLADKLDPEANLRDYLAEKGTPSAKISQLAEAARPIISQAMASKSSTQFTGAFVPISIDVKNYRNYSEEHFDFSDITFCVINGQNGAGKSSLFMDAILDCLYEEPREGDLTGWIRADEEARSGSISFVFRVGEHTFRVVRTRAKSGKATLNLSKQIDGEWFNRSHEKIRDTQAEIVNILGMDSLTFRSCALIMQDQYGLFLQADKEARMRILGNILGLGIYENMEQIARVMAAEGNRQIAHEKAEISALQAKTSAAGEPEQDIARLSQEAGTVTATLSPLNLRRDSLVAELTTAEQSLSRIQQLDHENTALIARANALSGQLDEQNRIVHENESILQRESEIQAGVNEYNTLLAKEKALAAGQAMYTAKINELASVEADIRTASTAVQKAEADKRSAENGLSAAQKRLMKADTLKQAAEEYDNLREDLTTAEGRSGVYISMSEAITEAQQKLSGLQSAYNTEAATRKATLQALEKQSALLDNCNCIDPNNANCAFLADARKAREKIKRYRAECTEWKYQQLATIEQQEKTVARLLEQRNDLGYDAERVALLRSELDRLEPNKKEYDGLAAVREQVRLLEQRVNELATAEDEQRKHLSGLTTRSFGVRAEMEKYKTAAKECEDIQTRIEATKTWLEQERFLPIARERMAAAETKMQELKHNLHEVQESREKCQNSMRSEQEKASRVPILQSERDAVESKIADLQKRLDMINMELGSAQQRLRDKQQTESAISEIQKRITEQAARVALCETLKNAFSQDGIPHFVIRSILPILTVTANTILGQMTGGKMGMDFVTSKVMKSNNKKEVVTLDILIEEFGKATLPYLSKSGGEKVKASLSAILALAEIKSSQAGIQLGMLFIDEPPFLDADGIQAYCDALETIQARYKDLKVMAVTHDPTMKARFPQSVEVIKTAAGSKVVYS